MIQTQTLTAQQTATITPERVKAALNIVQAIAETIREIGRIPSGHLYAQLMSRMSLSEYENIIDILKRAGVVEVKNYELIWIGK